MTILEGGATVLDGVKRSRAALGQPLAETAIVETSADTRLLRIEWPDGRMLNLGPATRVMLFPQGFAPRGKPGPAAYVLQGWVKYGSAQGSSAPGLATDRFLLAPFQGTVVVQVSLPESWIFAQEGTVPLIETRSLTRHELSAGGFYARSDLGPGAAMRSAPSNQLKSVPRAFRDTLPLRYPQVTAQPAAIEMLPSPSYADLQAWLTAAPPVTTGFASRFRPLLRDRAFRKELSAHLVDHPEWRPILYPPPPPPALPSTPGR